MDFLEVRASMEYHPSCVRIWSLEKTIDSIATLASMECLFSELHGDHSSTENDRAGQL